MDSTAFEISFIPTVEQMIESVTVSDASAQVGKVVVSATIVSGIATDVDSVKFIFERAGVKTFSKQLELPFASVLIK